MGEQPAASTWQPSLRRLVEQLASATALEALAHLAELAHQVDRATADAVAEARAGDPPASWQTVADALGITRQAAHERFSATGRASAAGRRWRRRGR